MHTYTAGRTKVITLYEHPNTYVYCSTSYNNQYEVSQDTINR